MENNSAPTGDMKFDAKDVEENKLIAALSYIGILVLVPLLAKKESKFAQAHAKQGLVMMIAMFIAGVLGWVPVIGWAYSAVVFVLAIIAFFNAIQGKFWKIPVAFELSKKLNI